MDLICRFWCCIISAAKAIPRLMCTDINTFSFVYSVLNSLSAMPVLLKSFTISRFSKPQEKSCLDMFLFSSLFPVFCPTYIKIQLHSEQLGTLSVYTDFIALSTGCRAGYHGNKCQHACSSLNQRCTQCTQDGQCTACSNGYVAPTCTGKCHRVWPGVCVCKFGQKSRYY